MLAVSKDVALPVVPSDPSAQPSERVVPRTLLFNAESNLLSQPLANLSAKDALLQTNLRHTMALHEDWVVHMDDDARCLGLFDSPEVKELSLSTELARWYANSDEPPPKAQALPAKVPYYSGKYRSDLCRLLQAYTHGGVYTDNDLQLLGPIDDLLQYNFSTSLESPRGAWRGRGGSPWGETALFQALLASRKHSGILRRSILYWDAWATGKHRPKGLLGPSLLMDAIRDESGCDPATEAGRDELRKQGINILMETTPTPSDFSSVQASCLSAHNLGLRLRHHRETNLCGFLVEDWRGRPVAYSRMMRSGEESRACMATSLAENAVWTCRCRNPFKWPGYSCTSGDAASGTAQDVAATCGPGYACSRPGTWDRAFDSPRCGGG